ncbi:MAG: ATP-binding protein, partial [Acidimicrobiaceae bacterium]|nr:ATP-binding protein [Acidimicrobiaceae bacterium]
MTDPDPEARELEALRERLSLLSEASARINASLDFDVVLQGVLDSARSLTAGRYGVMTLLDEGGQVQDSLSSGTTAEEAEQLWRTPDSHRIFEALTQICEPLRVVDLVEHVRSLGFDEFRVPMPVEVFSFLAAPMFYRGARVGHVFVGDKDGGAGFTRADEETLVMFASQAALVIANARRHRDEQRARADLETLVNTSPVGVVVIDAVTGEHVLFNRETMRIVESLQDADQSLEELLEVVTCVRADGREVSLEGLPLSDFLSAGETIRAEEIVLRVPDGRSVSALLNTSPIRSGDGVVVSFVVTLQDMARLHEQERLRAEFLAMVSHELRTPLAAVKGSVATLLDPAGGLDPVETAQFLQIIRDQSEQMRHLIGDLLDVARIDTGALAVTPEPVDVNVLVDDARSRFVAAGATNTLEVELAPGLPLVMADRRRVVQVLSNLLFNAAAYSPDGSSIRVAAARDGIHVEVSVTDQGRGIPAEQMPELFRKFSRLGGADHGSGLAGSGLGLAICKGIVEAHGGRIWADSAGAGLGARFTFTLPVAEAPTGAWAAGSARSRPASQRQVRVLAVDDDPHALRYIRDTLTRAG